MGAYFRSDDPLPDLKTVRANWIALAIYGKAAVDRRAPSGLELNGIPLSLGSVANLFAHYGWLMTLRTND